MKNDFQSEQSRDGKKSGRSWWKLVFTVIGLLVAVAYAEPFIPVSGSSESLESVSTYQIQRGELLVTVTEQGTLESSNNTEIKCRVRGDNIITWVIESGTEVKPGDELLRLETLLIEEEISERTKFAHLAKSEVARSSADVARAKLAISEYLDGRFVTELASLQKDLAIAESQLLSARNRLSHAKKLARSKYASDLEVEEKRFAVSQAELNVKLTKTKIDVLNKFTKQEELASLKGALNAAKANYAANAERAFADEQRLKRAQEELEYCVITANRGGMVIYPTGQAWENAPEIEEGATVHKDQTLLLMPDLTQMQVKVGIHESIIDRISSGLSAIITLPGRELSGEISSVASVAKPAGWWTGNVVKYDTIVSLPSVEGLKPGMSVEVEVILARHTDVLMVPTAAVIETNQGHACWVRNGDGVERRAIELGDGSEMFVLVKSGVNEGEQVVLDPLAHITEAQQEAAKSIDQSASAEVDPNEFE